MAAVGQTWPQAMQLGWQPLRPDAVVDHRTPQTLEPGLEQGGLNDVGRADAHALAAPDAPGQEALFVQGPGGRMRQGSRFSPASPPTSHIEARTSPDPEMIKPRRDRSGNPASPAAEARPAKVIRPAGQWSRQFRHMTHSPTMMVPAGRQAPSQ